MNQLQKEILQAIQTGTDKFWSNEFKDVPSAVASEFEKLAIKWIEKLVSDFEEVDMEDSHLRMFYERWLKDNGLTE